MSLLITQCLNTPLPVCPLLTSPTGYNGIYPTCYARNAWILGIIMNDYITPTMITMMNYSNNDYNYNDYMIILVITVITITMTMITMITITMITITMITMTILLMSSHIVHTNPLLSLTNHHQVDHSFKDQ